MALQPTRREFRVTISHVDRGINETCALIVGQHPSETGTHLMLRVLGFCLYREPALEFGPGLSTPDAADLWAHDLTGQLTMWVECGAAPAERVKKIVQHNPHAKVFALFDDPRRADELVVEVATWKRQPKAEQFDISLVDAKLVAALAVNENRRREMSVTIVGDHIYVTEGDASFDGPVTRRFP